MFTAGQIPAISGLDDQPDTFEDQVRQTILNLRSVLEAAGSGLEHVVKVNTYLTDPGQLEEYNRVYSEFFGAAKPARTRSASACGAWRWKSTAWPWLPATPAPGAP